MLPALLRQRRHPRPAPSIATLAAALSLLGGAQALAPSSAIATDGSDETCILQKWFGFEVGGVCVHDDGGAGTSSGDGSDSGGGEANTCSADGAAIPDGELVCVEGETPYDHGGRPLGSRPGPSVGGDGGREIGPSRGAGPGSRPTPPRKPAPLEPWPPKRVKKRADSLRGHNSFISCANLYLDIQRYHWENGKLQTGEWNVADFFLAKDAVSSGDFARARKLWARACLGPVPDDET
jgi:hypothetical protein